MTMMPRDDGGAAVQMVASRFDDGDKIAIGAASVPSIAITGSADLGEVDGANLVADAACHYKIGAAPTAVDDKDSQYLPADQIVWTPLKDGDKVAVIRHGTSSGNLYIMPTSAGVTP